MICSPWQRILIALISGIFAGLLLGHKAQFIKPLGILFIHAINLMVVPVVFVGVICAVLSMDSMQAMKRIGIKAILIYCLSMAFASSMTLLIASFIAPGAGLHHLDVQSGSAVNMQPLSWAQAIADIIPPNPVAALASGNILQILVFALILGIAIQQAGKAGERIAAVCKSLSHVVMQLTQVIMQFAPVGIFALMAWVSGEYGLDVLLPLFKLVLTIYFCCILLCFIFYIPTLYLARISPLKFFNQARHALLLAFSTASSTATLPVTLRCAESLGISKNIAAFLLPLGTTMNLNGLSIYLSASVIFAANLAGVHLSLTQFVTVVATIILTSMGAGGVPGSTIVVMGAVLGSVGLPITVVSLIAGVDRLNDMAGTTTNVIGDLYAATLVAKSEGEEV